MGALGSVAAGDGMREVGEEPKELSFPAIHDSALEKKLLGWQVYTLPLYNTTTHQAIRTKFELVNLHFS